MNKIHALILASGSGIRAEFSMPKQFIKIGGKTVIEHTIDIFERNKMIDDIIIVINPSYRILIEDLIVKNGYKKIFKILNGGLTRQESSFIGVNSIKNDDDKVLIHDAVRPFLTNEIIYRCIKALEKYNSIDVAIPSTDTVIEVDDNNFIKNIPTRNSFKRGQTPQCFKVKVIKEAHKMAIDENNTSVTDDCSLVLRYKLSDIFVINGDRQNIKITYPEDMYLADKFFQIKAQEVAYSEINLNKLKDKTLVVFGASSGIGESIIHNSEKYGAKTFGFSRKNGIDITNYNLVLKALKEVFSKTNRIDFIVNSAAILNIGTLESRKNNEIVEEINTNYLGTVNVSKASIDFLKKTNGSLLLFTSSSYTRGRALYSIYSSTKSAVVNLTQALAEELLIDKIRVNVVNPERTSTPMRLKNFGKEPKDSLLDPNEVALISLKVLLSNFTGGIIDVRKEQFLQREN